MSDVRSLAEDTAAAIVNSIVRLVPAARWSYATVCEGGGLTKPLSSSGDTPTLAELSHEVRLQRQKVKAGPRIAATLSPLNLDRSSITMLFADVRTTYGALVIFQPLEAVFFTSAEIAMLTFALDSACDRLAALSSDLEARVAKSEPVERSVYYRAPDRPEGAMYILDLDLKIVLSWSAETDKRVAAIGLRTQPASRLPAVLEQSVRSLTATQRADATFPPGLASPLPFLVLRTTPMTGDMGLFVGVHIDRVRPVNSLTEATLRYKISPREGQVLALLLDGHHLEEIARLLSISSSTVQDHIKSMNGKTGSRNRSELIAHIFGWKFDER